MARSRSIRRLLHRFVQVGHRRRALTAKAVAWLLLARLALIFVPFPRLARRFGTFVPPTDARTLQARNRTSPAHAQHAEDIGWAVTRSARYVPFGAVCLPQAVAARVMLKRRGVASVLHFGAAQGKAKPIDAHAWLDAASVEVTGYPVGEDFAKVGCFV
jgi:transglutaminase superfamily protein